jgi:alkaline phosphatase
MKFLPKAIGDPLNSKQRGVRIDGRNLIQEWTEKMKSSQKKYKYVWNVTDFRKTNYKNYEHVLGIF